MSYQYHFKTNTLFSDGIVLMATAHEINDIGACAKCAGMLKSLSSHRQNGYLKSEEKYFIVSSCAECLTIYVHRYDSNWSWLDENEPELTEYAEKSENSDTDHDNSDKISINKTNDSAFQIPIYNDIILSYDDLNQIPLLKLKSVFSDAEIQTLVQKSKKEKYIRQYYHRAKKKYKDFEEIFGIKLEI